MYKHHLLSIYLYGEFFSGNKYAFLQSNLFETNGKIYDEVYTFLDTSKIKWIISQDIEKFKTKGKIEKYILENYEIVDKKVITRLDFLAIFTDDIVLYKYKNAPR